ncbi:hypothetical protein F511_30000 [Dorcoceras hygrometricum]|uniref:Uncharacterized protein n=1 Tax=Dorcoceras hygrometricum TaxID=472368 RepID=A0A2Z7CTE5_9LAMI|nr:hypothetical protein F511_30000 [Dorcoceras hygrometricum]
MRSVVANHGPRSSPRVGTVADPDHASRRGSGRTKFGPEDRFDEENPFVQNSSVLLVQPDEGVSVLVVDRIGDYLPQSTEKSRVLVIPVGARHKCQQDSIGYPRMSASGESLTTMHRLLHASGSHPIPPPYDPKTNQYNQDLRLIHSTNGNHLESPNEGSSIDHQVIIYLHAQNITMFPTNETWYFASQILVSSSGGLILIFDGPID